MTSLLILMAILSVSFQTIYPINRAYLHELKSKA